MRIQLTDKLSKEMRHWGLTPGTVLIAHSHESGNVRIQHPNQATGIKGGTYALDPEEWRPWDATPSEVALTFADSPPEPGEAKAPSAREDGPCDLGRREALIHALCSVSEAMVGAYTAAKENPAGPIDPSSTLEHLKANLNKLITALCAEPARANAAAPRGGGAGLPVARILDAKGAFLIGDRVELAPGDYICTRDGGIFLRDHDGEYVTCFEAGQWEYIEGTPR